MSAHEMGTIFIIRVKGQNFFESIENISQQKFTEDYESLREIDAQM